MIFYSLHFEIGISQSILAKIYSDIHIKSLNNLYFRIFVIFGGKHWFGQKVDTSVFVLIFLVLLLTRTIWLNIFPKTSLVHIYFFNYLIFFIYLEKCDLCSNHSKWCLCDFYSLHFEIGRSQSILAKNYSRINIKSLKNWCFMIFVIFGRKQWFVQKVDKSIFPWFSLSYY